MANRLWLRGRVSLCKIQLDFATNTYAVRPWSSSCAVAALAAIDVLTQPEARGIQGQSVFQTDASVFTVEQSIPIAGGDQAVVRVHLVDCFTSDKLMPYEGSRRHISSL